MFVEGLDTSWTFRKWRVMQRGAASISNKTQQNQENMFWKPCKCTPHTPWKDKVKLASYDAIVSPVCNSKNIVLQQYLPYLLQGYLWGGTIDFLKYVNAVGKFYVLTFQFSKSLCEHHRCFASEASLSIAWRAPTLRGPRGWRSWSMMPLIVPAFSPFEVRILPGAGEHSTVSGPDEVSPEDAN